MRKIVISFGLAVAVIAAAAPVAAEARAYARSPLRPVPVTPADTRDLVRELNEVDAGIARALRRRAISQREAASLRRDAARVRAQLNRARRGGVGDREFWVLRHDLNRLQERLRLERR